MEQQKINFPMLVMVVLISAALFIGGWWRLRIDTDIVSSLPRDDALIADALHVFLNHPMQDQVTIDVGMQGGDLDLLVACGQEVARVLASSRLFESVGLTDMQSGLPLLAGRVAGGLPFLFTRAELERHVLPLLEPAEVRRVLARQHTRMLSMEGIGQSAFLAQDPLGLKDLVLARLIHLAPTQAVRFHQGELISEDGRHLLVVATPTASGTNTAFARELSLFFKQVAGDIEKKYAASGAKVTLTPVGAYRAALDNEEMVRQDVENAILYATLGIVVLLLLAFPRPLMGLLSLLPALVGAATALFVYSLIHPSISIMVLGFGGAIISITVDHGIAYLLFLDRPHATSGRTASHEVRAVGLLATLTTVGAFMALTFSSFPIFQQLGLFTALGIGFSFITVHLVFPLIFPTLAPASSRFLPLPGLARRIFSTGLAGALAALVLLIGLSFWSNPGFNVNLSAMNSVSDQTRSAEKTLTSVWGDIFSKVFVMTEAPNLKALQSEGDRLLAMIEADPMAELQQQIFLPSMVFPGNKRRAANLSAWKAFWNADRTASLKESLSSEGERLGFSAGAFDPFFKQIESPEDLLQTAQIPAELFPILGIVPGRAQILWRQVVSFGLPGTYSAQKFYQRYHSAARIFEPGLFSDRLGEVLFHTFLKLMVSIAVAVTVLLLFFFLDVRLTLVALLPMIFAFVCTLGSLNLLGRSIDIPGLMLAIVVLGMGIDYSLFLVRAYQRYGSTDNPHFSLIQLAVVMASVSTLIGFGVLIFARHSLLKSAGITSFLGIGFSLLGAALILPPFLENFFTGPASPAAAGMDIDARVRWRYRKMEAFTRMFARFKLWLDPMFAELEQQLACERTPKVLMDIGCGYGVPANWLAERYPGCMIYSIDPDYNRVHAASRTLDKRGKVVLGAAPDLPPAPDGVDVAFMLDMLHYLNDSDLELTLKRIREKLTAGGRLVLRVGMVPTRKWPWSFWLENFWIKVARQTAHYRDQGRIEALLARSGFNVQAISPSGRLGELVWFQAQKSDLN